MSKLYNDFIWMLGGMMLFIISVVGYYHAWFTEKDILISLLFFLVMLAGGFLAIYCGCKFVMGLEAIIRGED